MLVHKILRDICYTKEVDGYVVTNQLTLHSDTVKNAKFLDMFLKIIFALTANS
jgi:hypothetical protein